MRHLLLALLVAGTAFSAVLGRSLPLTIKEVTLMLRSGYSSDAVQRELSVRRLAESCDAAAEKALTNAGAAPALIDAIKSGSYESSPADAQAAREQLAAQAERRAVETERMRKMDTLYQHQQRARASAPVSSKSEASTVLTDFLKGDLVFWKNGSLSRFDDEALGKKKLVALYFSAHWCAPCRKFTPQLVEFYNRVTPQHPEFEIVFVSCDRSPFGMETYMRDTQMPWPAIEFGKLPGKEALRKYAGEDIPCLVVVDASGKVVSDTYAGKKYIGPEKVLMDLDAIFAKTSTTAIAATR
jgi:thiol-disulfide isomerase/thioredoxin